MCPSVSLEWLELGEGFVPLQARKLGDSDIQGSIGVATLLAP